MELDFCSHVLLHFLHQKEYFRMFQHFFVINDPTFI